MSDTEIFHVYNEDGNDIDEHLLLIVHRKVEDELEEKSFIKRFFKGFFLLW